MKIMLGADAIRYPLTGIGRYTYELGSRLQHHESIENIRYFRGGAVKDTLPSRPSNVQTAKAGTHLKRFIAKAPLLVEAYQRYSTMLQKRTLREFSDYIFHGPNYYLPAHSGPCVATFHDLSVFKWPECSPAWRVRYMQKELPLAIKRADVLVTDSEFTRQEVAAYFNWPLNRIIAAPLAAPPEYRPMAAHEVTPVIQKWKLNFGSYALFVGTMDPRKNVDALLDAYERMPHAMRSHHPLVVAGFEGWKSERTIARLRNAERAGWAHYLGFVDEASLPALYAGARVFLFPSRYEGFGLPVLEAMATGVPVICSDAASLPEVTGSEGAVLVPCEDTDALFNALLRALDDDAWCNLARKRGLERASQFSWDHTVAMTLAAYKLAGQ